MVIVRIGLNSDVLRVLMLKWFRIIQIFTCRFSKKVV